MKLLKYSLVAMGVLIIIGFGFIILVTYQRISGVGYFAKSPHEPSPTSPAASPSITALGLPNDARVEAIHDIGNRVLLLIRHPGFGDRLYLMDPHSGAVGAMIAIGQIPPVLNTPMVNTPPQPNPEK
ncbi:MAG: hypothetical protein WCK65_11370 [Rhodospirillaceae bacterium]